MPVNESNTIQYTVTASNTGDGTVLYWRTTGNTTNSDISGGNTGTITIVNNQALLNVTVIADGNTDGTKTLGITLSTTLNGPAVVNTANPIIVNDTSLSPPAGALYAWGRNSYGQLGFNDQVNRSSPVQVGAATYWSKIESGAQHTLALKNDSTLWAWGRNYGGVLGTNSAVYRSSPVQVGTDTWSQISVSAQALHSLAIKTNNTLWAWGTNANGQLGTNDRVYRSSPVQLGTDTWSQINCGQICTAAVKTDGTLWTWGNNSEGQLGLGDQIQRSSPVQVGALTNWSQVSVNGTAAAAVKTNGTLWTWGDNTYGQNALGNTVGYVRRLSPQQVGSLTNWSMVKFGAYSCLALKTDGTMWSWGSNTNGVLGHNQAPSVDKSSPVQIGTDTTWSKITLGKFAAAAIKTNGTLWLWGQDGYYGNLGFNTRVVYKSSPTQIGSGTNWNQVSTASENTLALTIV